MKTPKTGAGLAAALVATLALAACGDVQDGGKNGGYAAGWQPGRYVATSQAQQAVITDSGIRNVLLEQARLARLPKDGWHGRLLLEARTAQRSEVVDGWQSHLDR